jgi:hypothetical protein
MEATCIAIPAKRPAEGSKITLPDSHQVSSKLLKAYEDLQYLYLLEGVSQQSQVLVRKIAGVEPVSGTLQGVEIVPMLSRIATNLMLNELEIVGWSIYLVRLLKPNHCTQPDVILTYTAVAAKYYFDDNIGVIQAFLEKSIPNFTKGYNDWFRSHSQILHISPKELNDRFKLLSEVELNIAPKELLDYNSLVEDILQSTPVHSAPDPPQTFPIIPVPIKIDPLEIVKIRQVEVPEAGDEPPTPEFTYNWSVGLSIEKLGSLSDLWPDQYSLKKRRTDDSFRLP